MVILSREMPSWTTRNVQNATRTHAGFAGTVNPLHDGLVTFDWLTDCPSGREFGWHGGRRTHSSPDVETILTRLLRTLVLRATRWSSGSDAPPDRKDMLATLGASEGILEHA